MVQSGAVGLLIFFLVLFFNTGRSSLLITFHLNLNSKHFIADIWCIVLLSQMIPVHVLLSSERTIDHFEYLIETKSENKKFANKKQKPTQLHTNREVKCNPYQANKSFSFTPDWMQRFRPTFFHLKSFMLSKPILTDTTKLFMEIKNISVLIFALRVCKFIENEIVQD